MAINFVSAITCPFNKNGEGNSLICYFDQAGNIYQSTKNQFCQNFPNFELQGQNTVYTLDYCLYHQCLKKDCLEIAKALKNENQENGMVKLKIDDKICFEDLLYHQQRKIIDLNYFSMTSEQDSSAYTITKCCQTECQKKFKQQGCSSSGLFYTLNDFCDEFCKNRDLFLLDCPTEGCSASACLQIDTNFPKFQHCQINAGTMTLEDPLDLHTYFNSIVAGLQITQQFILCYDEGIQIPCESLQHCYQQQCLQELSQYDQICNKSGHLYDLKEFCQLNAASTITSYLNEIILCDGNECSNENLCCNNACVAFRDTLILPTCYLGKYYTQLDNFCVDFCNTDLRKNQSVCRGLGCYEAQCCARAFPDGYCKSDYQHEQCQTDSLSQLPIAQGQNQEECDKAKIQEQVATTQNIYYCYEKNNQIFIEYDFENYLLEKAQNNVIDIEKLNCKNPPCNIYDCKYFDCINDNKTQFNGKCDQQLQLYQSYEQFCNSIIYNFKKAQMCGESQCNLTECYGLRYQDCLGKQTNYKTKCSLDFQLYTIENFCDDQSKDIVSNYYQCNDNLGNELNCQDCLYFQCMQIQTETTSLCISTDTSYFSYYGTLKDFCLANAQKDFSELYTTRTNCQKEIGCAHSLDCCYHQCLISQIKLTVCDENYLLVTPEQACYKQCYQSLQITKQCTENCTIEDCRKKKCLDELLDFPGNICYKVDPNQQFTFSNDSRKFFVDKQSFCDYIKIEQTKNDYQDFVNNASYCENCDNEYCCCVENCLIEKPFISCVAMKDSNEYSLTSITQTCELGCKHQGHKIKYCDAVVNSIHRNCEQKECNYFQCMEQTSLHSGIVCLFGQQYQYQFFTNTNQFCSAYQEKNMDYMDKIRNENHKCNDEKSCSSEEDCCVDKCRNVDYYQACSSDFRLLTKFEYCEIKCTQDNPVFYYCFGQGGQLTHCNDCSFQACQHYVEDTYKIKQVQSNEVCGHHFEKFSKVEDFCNFIENQSAIKLIFCKDQFGNHRICSQQECCQKYCLDNQYGFQPHCDNINYNFFHTIEEFCNIKCNQPSMKSYKINNQYASEYSCCVQKCKLSKTESTNCILTVENSLVFDLYTTEGICDFECRNIPYSIHTCKGNNCQRSDCDFQKCLFEVEKTNFEQFCGSNGILYQSSTSFCNASQQESMLHMKHVSCDEKQCKNVLDCCKAACMFNTKGNNICEANSYKCYDDLEQLCEKQCGWVEDPSSMYEVTGLFIKDENCQGDQEKICHLQKCIDESCQKHGFSYNVCMRNKNCTIFVQKTPTQLCDYFKSFEYQGCPAKILDYDFYNIRFQDLVLQNRIKVCKDKDTPRDCTQEECQVWPCEKLLQNDQGNDVCYEINSEVFYEKTFDYCIKFNSVVSHTFYRCNGQQCLSKEACCEAVCLSKNKNFEFVPLCDSNLNELRTLEQYCRDKCHNNSFDILTCGNKNCTLDKCRIFKCQQQFAQQICDDQFQLTSSYSQCLEDNFQKQYYTCFDSNNDTVDCTIQDCETFKCLQENQSYLDGAICLQQPINDQYFFQNKQEYCQFMAQNNLFTQYSLFNKNSMQCINSQSQIAQCKSSCCTCSKCEMDLFGFSGQILASNNVLFYSPKEFCRWKYVNKIPLEIKKCFGNNQTTVCLEATCETEIQEGIPSEMYGQCLNNDKIISYQGDKLCGEDGLLYDDRYNFCSKLLQQSIFNFEPLTCDFTCPEASENMNKPFCLHTQNKTKCSQKECKVYKCMAQLRKQDIIFPLCLNQPYNDVVFYQTSKHFCMDKIQNFDEDYTLNKLEINLECYQKNNCNAFLCYGLSFVQNYKIGRIGTKLVTALEYQHYMYEQRYQNQRDHPFFLNEIEFCHDDQGVQINCPSVCNIETDCKQYCINYLREQGYPFDTICIRNRFQEVEYYNNLEDFCIYVAIQEDYNFDKYRDYFLCGENGDEQCTNQNSCFLTNCIKHPEDIPALVQYLDKGNTVIKSKCEEIYGKKMVQLQQNIYFNLCITQQLIILFYIVFNLQVCVLIILNFLIQKRKGLGIRLQYHYSQNVSIMSEELENCNTRNQSKYKIVQIMCTSYIQSHGCKKYKNSQKDNKFTISSIIHHLHQTNKHSYMTRVIKIICIFIRNKE